MQTRLLTSAFLIGSLAVAGCGADGEELSGDDVRNEHDLGETGSEQDGGRGGQGGEDGGARGTPSDPGPSNDDGAGGPTEDPGNAGEPAEPKEPEKPAPLATAIRIDKLVLYQSVAIPLMTDGQAVQHRKVPVVAGKDAMLRVHVAPMQGFSPRELAVEVDFEGASAPAPLRLVKNVRAASSDGDLGSTFNFEIPGEHVTPDLSLRVAIRETKGDGPDGSSDAIWPSSGHFQIGTESSNGDLRIVIVPVRYDGDRSGRLPDTSPAQIERFRKRFQATFPIPDAKIEVRQPIAFSESFSRNGNGWSRLLNQTCAARQQDRPPRNAYYYGLIMPASSFSAYCGGSCVTGLGNVVQQPSDEYGRCAIGLGFGDDRSLNTALHEIGHAMGRNHAPCGGPSGVDRGYPYSNASIGVYGYDFFAKQLREPSKYKDFLSYCDPQWVSDYTYNALFERISYVNGTMSVHVEPTAVRTYRVALIDGEGHVEWGETLELSTPPSGEQHELATVDGEGKPSGTIKGHFYPYSHLPGGTMLVPTKSLTNVQAIEMPKDFGGRVLELD